MKQASLSYKTLLIIFIFILCAFLLPLLSAGMYAVPCADDYSYGYEAHRVFTETGSPLKAILRGLEHVGEVYTIWQGTYSAIFLFSVQPAIFGERLYALTSVIMLTALTAGCIAVCVELFSGVFGLDKRLSACVGCVCVIACTQLLPSPVQGFYWYNGAIFYTFFYGLSLIAFALGIRCIKSSRRAPCVWLCVLCAFLGGGNYVTALSCVIAAVSTIVLLALLRDGRWKKLLVPTAVLLVGFGISVAAPGNFIRQSTVADSPGVFEAIFMSFAQCAGYSLCWFSPALIAILALAAPAVARREKIVFQLSLPAARTAVLLLCPVGHVLPADIRARQRRGIQTAQYHFLRLRADTPDKYFLSSRLGGKKIRQTEFRRKPRFPCLTCPVRRAQSLRRSSGYSRRRQLHLRKRAWDTQKRRGKSVSRLRRTASGGTHRSRRARRGA